MVKIYNSGHLYQRLVLGINDVISVDDIKFNDTISPLGISKNGEIWANPDDIIIASSNLIYNDTNLELVVLLTI